MSLFNRIFIYILLFFNFSLPANAFEGKSSKTILDNGLTVLITEMPTSSTVSVYGLAKCGSATEGKYLGSGISHFVEHMLFKGTEDRAVGVIAEQIQAVGGSINASTSMDQTMYTITVPKESFDTALNILSDALVNSVFDSKEVEKEREVIFGEMRMRNDDPDRRLGEITYRTIYTKHPYRHPIIGYDSVFAEISRDDLFDYYQTFYIPDNMIISVAGNVKTEEVLPKIKSAFEDFKRKRSITRNLPQEPKQLTPRRYEETYPTPLTRMSISFPGTELLHQDLYALDVLATILGQGESSRLYLDLLKRRQLVYQIYSYNYTPMEKGFFQVVATLDHLHVKDVISAVKEHIHLIKDKGVTKDELEKAKRQVLSNHIFSQQTSSSVAYSQAVDEAYTGDYQFSDKYVEAIRQVTVDDVKEVAKQYLNEEAMSVVILKPETVAEIKQEEERLAVGEIKKVVLDNGLTLLLRQDSSFPSVSVQFVLNGGTRYETADLNGLCNLTSLLWTKGTKSYSADQLSKKVEGLGMGLNSFSGKNSFGLTMNFLKEDTLTALDILEDLIKNPSFSKEELIKLKELVKTNIKENNDDIFFVTAQALKELTFPNHPFRLDKNGTLESVNRISQEDIVSFYNNLAVANNSVLAIYGDINSDEIIKIVSKKFGTLTKKELAVKNFKEDRPDQPRERGLFMDKEQAMVIFGFQGVDIKHQDYYGVEILSSILGSSFSGRMFTNIRDKLAHAYTLGGQFAPALDTGFIYFYVLTKEESVDEVKKLLKQEIEKIQRDDVLDKELADIKQFLKGNYQADLETNSSLASATSFDELYGLGFDRYQKYNEFIDGVSKEDIKRLANEYLDLNRVSIVVTHSTKGQK